MAGEIFIDSLASAIAAELAAYSQEVADGIKVQAKAIAADCVKEVKASSPVLTKSYQKGWRAKVAFESRENIRCVIHNKTDYQLTHLLEHGFTGRNGKRVEGRPRIGPAEQQAVKRFTAAVKEAIENAGK